MTDILVSRKVKPYVRLLPFRRGLRDDVLNAIYSVGGMKANQSGRWISVPHGAKAHEVLSELSLRGYQLLDIERLEADL